MWKDFRFAWRGLARSPGFALAAILTLALGIGASTAVFTLVDGVLLRPLPYPAADRLVSLDHEGRGGEDQLPISPGLYFLYRDHARTLSSVAVYRDVVVNLVGDGGEAERVDGQAVTPSLFDVLRVAPLMGRPLLTTDGEPGAEPVMVLSRALWRSRFGEDPATVGRTVDVDGVSRRVVGVMPAGFHFPAAEVRLWIPMEMDPVTAPLGAFGLGGVGRMADGATPEAVRSELGGLIEQLPELRPDAGPVLGFLREVQLKAVPRPLKASVVGDIGRTLWTLLGMVGFVLLIACANVANLLLVRAEGRQRELALRRAIGAGSWQVLRPFLAESLVLAGIGGALGAGLATVAVGAGLRMASADLPRTAEVGVDLRVLAFAAAASLLAALLFGPVPALRYARSDLSGRLKEGGAHGGTAGRERHRVRNALVVIQVALALVLLIGSGLMVRSMVALLAADPGFQAEGVLTARLSVPPGEIPEATVVGDYYRTLESRLRSQPGVLGVGAISAAPLTGNVSFFAHDIEDQPMASNGLPPLAHGAWVDPGYFEAMGVPVVEGRTLEDGDAGNGYRAVVVSQAFAQRWWPDGSALGKRLRPGGGEWWQVVGVVGNVRNRSLSDDPEEMVYYPTMVGEPGQPGAVRSRDLVIRVAGDPARFLPVLRREVRELNARIPLADARPFETVVARSASRTSFTMVVLGAASLVALLLGVIGIYGVVSYVVSQRTREIGVRIALGAAGSAVRGMVLGQGLMLAGVGVGLGVVGSLAASRLLASMLYGVSATDPLTYVAVAALLIGAAAAASWIPAMRAAAVDPAAALRSE